ncbi:DUF1819 family protein [Schaalia hyovaginalis]|uniref:DUF1819 family protein n=1 Tax=Schaalia hyovaginalis TaxID=29316 RepID=UPI0026EAE287|nr:DUF1819 family protein [Schaalia hyovaginalis]MCI6557836.1 DUF1819 family protein [Schaalia hyovaginalis]MDD7318346.1 DUF1819 family protein [Prevotellaceae bacterium]MDY3665122.1 DUF1819 family protein [Schaalia hyovaginalis]
MSAERSASTERYSLSFTVGGLFEREAEILARVYAGQPDWSTVRRIAIEENLLQARTRSTGIRMVRETLKRLAVLSDEELRVLPGLTAAERSHVMWAAACRQSAFIGEFAEEVLRERFLMLAGTLDYEDFDSFVRQKALWHEELVELTPRTYGKLRQTVFRMMTEAGLLSKEGLIQTAMLSPRVAALLPSTDVQFFPTKEA